MSIKDGITKEERINEIERIINLLDRFYLPEEIAKDAGVSNSTINKYRKLFGLIREKRIKRQPITDKYHKEEAENLAELFKINGNTGGSPNYQGRELIDRTRPNKIKKDTTISIESLNIENARRNKNNFLCSSWGRKTKYSDLQLSSST